ncbi:hypothetical protein [uncultured Bifidobacterium sp.]|uniref:hypothetical protein n=1 Tax=uncultured Bifidobacterium sp. TaxID=165187 RepID=UPI002625B747|nr:hypothetical protein [uncultured Bifidobacterium sp.]
MKTTAYYSLPIYEDADSFDLRDGYNEAMRILDQKLHQLDFKIRSQSPTSAPTDEKDR